MAADIGSFPGISHTFLPGILAFIGLHNSTLSEKTLYFQAVYLLQSFV